VVQACIGSNPCLTIPEKQIIMDIIESNLVSGSLNNDLSTTYFQRFPKLNVIFLKSAKLVAVKFLVGAAALLLGIL
jgi:hypothetical protein